MKKSLVIGATGTVGGYLMDHLSRQGYQPVGMGRSGPEAPNWIRGSIEDIADLGGQLPVCDTIFATISMPMLPGAIPTLVQKGATRIVAVSTTSILTKLESKVAAEREGLQLLVEGERNFIAACEAHQIGWTILRPTLIYAEGRDVNVTRLARFIRRFGFFPIPGPGRGLRQPVHAEDLALGAIAAALSPAARNKTYVVPGGETITYREMVGRIFDGLGKSRIIVPVPPALWRAAFTMAQPFFPGANAAMGDRMNKDMVFDPAQAERDFGWQPRGFRPRF